MFLAASAALASVRLARCEFVQGLLLYRDLPLYIHHFGVVLIIMRHLRIMVIHLRTGAGVLLQRNLIAIHLIRILLIKIHIFDLVYHFLGVILRDRAVVVTDDGAMALVRVDSCVRVVGARLLLTDVDSGVTALIDIVVVVHTGMVLVPISKVLLTGFD